MYGSEPNGCTRPAASQRTQAGPNAVPITSPALLMPDGSPAGPRSSKPPAAVQRNAVWPKYTCPLGAEPVSTPRSLIPPPTVPLPAKSPSARTPDDGSHTNAVRFSPKTPSCSVPATWPEALMSSPVVVSNPGAVPISTTLKPDWATADWTGAASASATATAMRTATRPSTSGSPVRLVVSNDRRQVITHP